MTLFVAFFLFRNYGLVHLIAQPQKPIIFKQSLHHKTANRLKQKTVSQLSWYLEALFYTETQECY